jgi:DNA-directed RNA polymerase subunit K/omega
MFICVVLVKPFGNQIKTIKKKMIYKKLYIVIYNYKMLKNYTIDKEKNYIKTLYSDNQENEDFEHEQDKIKIDDDIDDYSDNDTQNIIDDDDIEDDTEDDFENDIEDDVEYGGTKNLEENKTIIQNMMNYEDNEEEEEDDDEDNENYLQKFEQNLNKNYIVNNHKEMLHINYDEVYALSNVIRDNNGIIIDDLHKTVSFLTKYEKSNILGMRASQINSGSIPYIHMEQNIIDGLDIANMELEQKKIPIIIKRPIPGNGGFEYWKLEDLEIL